MRNPLTCWGHSKFLDSPKMDWIAFTYFSIVVSSMGVISSSISRVNKFTLSKSPYIPIKWIISMNRESLQMFITWKMVPMLNIFEGRERKEGYIYFSLDILRLGVTLNGKSLGLLEWLERTSFSPNDGLSIWSFCLWMVLAFMFVLGVCVECSIRAILFATRRPSANEFSFNFVLVSTMLLSTVWRRVILVWIVLTILLL